MAIPIPKSVSRVLKRLRPRFFNANAVRDNWDGMMLEYFLR
jgi:hypothetical protein